MVSPCQRNGAHQAGASVSPVTGFKYLQSGLAQGYIFLMIVGTRRDPRISAPVDRSWLTDLDQAHLL